MQIHILGGISGQGSKTETQLCVHKGFYFEACLPRRSSFPNTEDA